MAEDTGNTPWQPERGLNVSARLQNLRNLLDSDQQREVIEQEISLRANILERQRRGLDTNLQDRDPPTIPDNLPSSNSPSSIVRSRRRAFRPSERLQRHRERYQHSMRTDPSDTLANPRRVTPPPASAESMMDDYGTESRMSREQRYRSKRRKLDDGTFEDDTRVISYGDEGRVTPGPLKMEIIRCDGGDYYESTNGSAQFVLQDDKNVYSTKENKCSMLLKHIGGLPFSLTKLVIKSPSDGFDSPVQEGMIFVAMTDESLLEKTSQYETYSPRSHQFHHPYRRHDYYRPSQEYLNSSRSPLRSIDRSRHLRDPQMPRTQNVESSPELETAVVPGFEVTFTDPTDHEASPSFAPRSPASWRDLDAEYSLRSYTDRYRPNIRNNPGRDNASVTSSESEDEYVPPYRFRGNNGDELDEEFPQHPRFPNQLRIAHERNDLDLNLLHPSRRAQQDWRTIDTSTHRLNPNRAGLRTSASTHDETLPSNGTSSKLTAEILSRSALSIPDQFVPHARFSMAEGQTSIAINFEPPISGRYILIKLWAYCPASNIDIQCIIPHGYGGPRFFPSIEIR